MTCHCCFRLYSKLYNFKHLMKCKQHHSKLCSFVVQLCMQDTINNSWKFNYMRSDISFVTKWILNFLFFIILHYDLDLGEEPCKLSRFHLWDAFMKSVFLMVKKKGFVHAWRGRSTISIHSYTEGGIEIWSIDRTISACMGIQRGILMSTGTTRKNKVLLSFPRPNVLPILSIDCLLSLKTPKSFMQKQTCISMQQVVTTKHRKT